MAQTSTHDLTVGDTEVRKRFVDGHERHAEREWACLAVLAEHAPGLAPRPLRREVESGSPVVVMERLAGQPLGGAALTSGQTAELGRALRRLWDVPVGAAVAAGIGERTYGASTLPARMREWYAEHHGLDGCRDPRAVGRAVDAAREWLESPHLPEPRTTALGIADLNPANVLWDGATCRLVDFEDGGLSEPAYELADHVEHLGGRLTGLYDADRLADAVGLDGAERERMAAYRPLYAAFWLGMLLPGRGGWHRNPPGTTEAQAAHFLALLRAH